MRRLLLFPAFILFAWPAWAQPASGGAALDFVTLEMQSDVRGGCGEAKLEFVRTAPDGSASGPFRVPDGKILVVTDADWYYFSGQPQSLVALTIFVEDPADPKTRQRAAESALRLGPDGAGGANEHWTSGFPVTAGRRLCVSLVNAPLGSPLRLSNVLLHGYLTEQR